MENYLFTSEAVTEGHPDKICDRIADTILDEAIKQDKNSKMAVEATIKDELILIFGEMNTTAKLNFEKIAKFVLKDVGYNENYNVIVKVGQQSREINHAIVDQSSKMIGAGDQGIMFGFACDDTEVLMPAAIYYANTLAKRLHDVSKTNTLLKPDGKTKVTVEYKNGIFKDIKNIIISTQHSKDATQEQIEDIVINEVIKPVISSEYLVDTEILINPSGSFTIGGSFGDSGTTGRKIVCDTYGGYGRVGGGCLSSKDPTKVDRSASYYCRYVAKSIVANGCAKKCEIGVSYVIGKPNPISIYVDTFGTSKYSDEKIMEIINDNFDFSVSNIIEELDLKKPIYSKTSNYGHFGREEFPWERIKRLCIRD